MSELMRFLTKKYNFQNILRGIEPNSAQLVTGIADSARAIQIAMIAAKKNVPTIVFSPNLHQANQLHNDLREFYPDESIYIYNVNDMIHAQLSIASPEEQAERIETLEFLLSEKPGIIIIPIAGARRLLPPKEDYIKAHIHISLNEEVTLDYLMTQLVSMGYVREQIVATPGEFSVRGGILDVYPLTEKYPVRIEFFDIEVDSIRTFDADTQRSLNYLEKVSISPVTESILPAELREGATARIKIAYEQTNKSLETEEEKQELAKKLLPVIEALENNQWHEDFSYYTSFLFEHTGTIIDYIPKDSIVLFDEYSRILENNQRLQEEELEWIENQLHNQRLLVDQRVSQNFMDSQHQLNQPKIYFSLFQKGLGNTRFTSIHTFHYREMQKFFNQMPLIQAEMDGWMKKGVTVVVMAENEDRAKQIQSTFKDFN